MPLNQHVHLLLAVNSLLKLVLASQLGLRLPDQSRLCRKLLRMYHLLIKDYTLKELKKLPLHKLVQVGDLPTDLGARVLPKLKVLLVSRWSNKKLHLQPVGMCQ